MKPIEALANIYKVANINGVPLDIGEEIACLEQFIKANDEELKRYKIIEWFQRYDITLAKGNDGLFYVIHDDAITLFIMGYKTEDEARRQIREIECDCWGMYE